MRLKGNPLRKTVFSVGAGRLAKPENSPLTCKNSCACRKSLLVTMIALLKWVFAGNGWIHRYLIHHILSERGFNPPGVAFPVSFAILERIGVVILISKICCFKV